VGDSSYFIVHCSPKRVLRRVGARCVALLHLSRQAEALSSSFAVGFDEIDRAFKPQLPPSCSADLIFSGAGKIGLGLALNCGNAIANGSSGRQPSLASRRTYDRRSLPTAATFSAITDQLPEERSFCQRMFRVFLRPGGFFCACRQSTGKDVG
jgi:hypothetical protein